MRCSEPGVSVAVAIPASRGPVAELGALGGGMDRLGELRLGQGTISARDYYRGGRVS